MYLEFFGLREKPFNVTPDPHFLYMSPSHQEAFANLLYGVQERKGFITLSGEVGTGKTTLLHNLLANLEENTDSVFVFHTGLEFTDLLEMIHHELGIEIRSTSRAGLLQTLNHHLIEKLREGRNVALLIDEAQNLSPEILENLRLLSNLETSKEKLLQIILVGQPELEEKIALDELRQLRQRISVRSRIAALSREDCRAYILHRLGVAGARPGGTPIFSDEALDAIIGYAHGIPRQLNILCDGTLLLAYAEGDRQVKKKHVKEALSDLKSAIAPFEAQRGAQPRRTAVVGKQQVRGRPRWPWLAALLLLILPALLYGSYRMGAMGSGGSKRGNDSVAEAGRSIPGVVQRPAEETQPPREETRAPAETAAAPRLEEPPAPAMETPPASRASEASGERSAPPSERPSSELRRLFWLTGSPAALAELLDQCPRRIYTVRAGDYFSRVVFEQTGRQDTMVIAQIRKMNPHILDYNHIEPGWILYLPDFGE